MMKSGKCDFSIHNASMFIVYQSHSKFNRIKREVSSIAHLARYLVMCRVYLDVNTFF